MKKIFKGIALFSLSAIEKIVTPISVKWLKLVKNRVYSEKIFMRYGLLPVLDHYYEPMINPKKGLKKSLRDNRNLPGINFNTKEQLQLLNSFNYNVELQVIPIEKQADFEFYFNNGWYERGDAEYLYNMVRHFKPGKIIEIGCGSSSLMIQKAILKNKEESINYKCKHFCIEPFEQPWLEKIDAEIIREKVECMDPYFFQQLNANDILFIDSSHIIRPQGDVLFEYFEILPVLNSGVIVQIHDIFTPKDYPDEWINKHLFWNEQYLVEAFLSFNTSFRVIGALNYLAHNFPEEFTAKCPIFSQQPNEPKAFWLIKD